MIPSLIAACLSPILFDPTRSMTVAYWTPCPYYILGEDEPVKPFRIISAADKPNTKPAAIADDGLLIAPYTEMANCGISARIFRKRINE